jgi:hypothetical protein
MNLEHAVDMLSTFVDPELVGLVSMNRNMTSRTLLIVLHNWILAIHLSPSNMNLEHAVDMLSTFVDPELVGLVLMNRNMTSRTLLIVLHNWSHISKTVEGLNITFLHEVSEHDILIIQFDVGIAFSLYSLLFFLSLLLALPL